MNEAKLLKKTALTKDLYLLEFEKKIDFKPGQFVVLKTIISNKQVGRAYSIASSKTEKTLKFYVRKQPNGYFSKYLCDLSVGSVLQMSGPYGKFTPETDDVILIGAGTGISPFISVILSNPDDNYILLASVKTKDEIMAYDELKVTNSKIIYTITREKVPGFRYGRIDEELIKNNLIKQKIYVCGSNNFVDSIISYLQKLGVSYDRIITEKYGNITS